MPGSVSTGRGTGCRPRYECYSPDRLPLSLEFDLGRCRPRYECSSPDRLPLSLEFDLGLDATTHAGLSAAG